MLEVVHFAHHVLTWAVWVQAPTPEPHPTQSSTNLASLAALIASVTGLITAIGAIVLGLHRRDQNNPMADKAIEYLIKQNKELLRERIQPDGSKPRKTP